MDLRSFGMFESLNGNAMKSIQRFKAKKMRRYGLSGAHTNCLCRLLQAQEGGLTQSDLVQMEMLDPSQVSRVLRELIGKGYVSMDGEEGKYRRRYFLTEEGTEVAEEIRDHIDAVCCFVCRDIPEADMESFWRTFRRICDELKHSESVYLDDQTDD